MNPKLQKLLQLIGLITILIFGVIIYPRALSLYYQIKAGQQINIVLNQIDKSENFRLSCDAIPSKKKSAITKVEQAEIMLLLAIKYDPKNAQAYFCLGQAYCLLGVPIDAKGSFNKYIQLKPNNPLGYIGKGFTYEVLDNFPSAKNAWEKAGLKHEEFTEAGLAYFKERFYEDAIRWYELSILMDPNQADSWLYLGQAYDAMSSPDQVMDAYMKAWSIDPEFATTVLSLALIDNGEFEMLEEVLQQSLNKYPNSHERINWLQMLGDAYIDQGDINGGIDVYKDALQEFPNESKLYISLGWIYYNQIDDFQLALEEFKQAVELENTSGDVEIAIAKLFTEEERYQEADEYYLKALERSPNNRWYYLARGDNIRISGDIFRAIDIYLEIISLYPDFPNAYYQLAQAYRITENYPGAIEAIEQALKFMDPPISGYYTRAGEIYRFAGLSDKAFTAYHQALALNPNNKIANKGLQLLEEQ